MSLATRKTDTPQPESADPVCSLIYLDNGATSFPKPPQVYDFMDTFYRGYGVNPGRSGYDLCIEAGDLVEDTRKLLTKFFNGTDPSRLVFGYNATDALNLAIFGLLAPGDHAVTTHLEHNSTLRPLWHLQERGVEVDWVDFDETGLHRTRMRSSAASRRTPRRSLSTMASNVIGTVQDVAEGRRSLPRARHPLDPGCLPDRRNDSGGHRGTRRRRPLLHRSQVPHGPDGNGWDVRSRGRGDPSHARRRHRRAERAAPPSRGVPVSDGVRNAESARDRRA